MRVWHTQLVTPAESNTHSKMSNRHTRFQGYALAESNLHIKCYTLTKMSNRHTRFRSYALTKSNLHIRCYALAEFNTHDFEVTLAESDTLNFEVSFTIFTMQCTKSFMNCLFLLYKTIFESSCLKKKIWRKLFTKFWWVVILFLDNFFTTKLSLKRSISSVKIIIVWVKIKIIELLFSCTKHFWYWYKNYLIKDEILSTYSWLEKLQVTSAHTPIGNC